MLPTLACSPAAPRPRPSPPAIVTAVPTSDAALAEGGARVDAASEAPAEAATESSVALDDPMDLHKDTRAALLALLNPDPRLDAIVGMSPWHLNQGNKAAARHTIGRRACMEGLRGIVLQTDEQRARCGGAENMVPIYERGDPSSAAYCIDVFEFPNKACELPMLWVNPTQAALVCETQGKRLCAQEEWNLACRADPAGGKDSVYAYGDQLDLTVCNTNKSRVGKSPHCDIHSMASLWETCGTDSEPSGAFPRCRSRFGVFDQHGNLAEIMTRKDPWDPIVKTQLKGSAWFYVDVAKKHNEPGGYAVHYPDHCNFYPLWHVEPVSNASHANYHLGFRCCKSIANSPRDTTPAHSRAPP
jgi:sulfatase modifying factor 1